MKFSELRVKMKPVEVGDWYADADRRDGDTVCLETAHNDMFREKAERDAATNWSARLWRRSYKAAWREREKEVGGRTMAAALDALARIVAGSAAEFGLEEDDHE